MTITLFQALDVGWMLRKAAQVPENDLTMSFCQFLHSTFIQYHNNKRLLVFLLVIMLIVDYEVVK